MVILFNIVYPLLITVDKPLEIDSTLDNIYLVGFIIASGIFTYYIWNSRRKKIVIFLVTTESSIQNFHSLEVNFNRDICYTAQFRYISKPTLFLFSCYMPQDKVILREKIESLKNEIDELYTIIDREYYFAENFYDDEDLFPHIQYRGDVHDQNIISLNPGYYEKICLLRKIESVYILYEPLYRRKRTFKGEDD